MLKLIDGRDELWQWDTGRVLEVDEEITQVHFSNRIYGRSIDVDVKNQKATIPDVLLQVDKPLNVWAFVGTPEDGYTKISKVFNVNKKNKPTDYVFTPPEQTTLEQIKERLEEIEKSQDPEAIKNAVSEYLEENPVKETDPTVPQWAKEETKPTYTADEVGAAKKPFIVVVEKTDDYGQYKTRFNEMWTAYKNGRQVLISYMGRDYAEPVFYDDDYFEDGKGKRILVTFEDKKIEDGEYLANAAFERYEQWFFSDGSSVTSRYFIPNGIVQTTGNDTSLVMSQAATTSLFNKLNNKIDKHKSPNPEKLTINGVEYDGSEAVDVNIDSVKSWDDLADRPFGEGVVETLTYHGTLIGVTSISLGDGQYLVKLSDKPLTDPSALKSYTVSTPSDSTKITDFTIEGDDKMWSTFTEGSFGRVFNVIEADEEYASVGFTPGLWVSLVDSDGIKIYVSEVVFKTEGIKTIDEKFLPDSVKGGGGSAEWKLIKTITLAEAVRDVTISEDADGKPLALKSVIIRQNVSCGASSNQKESVYVNNAGVLGSMDIIKNTGYYAWSDIKLNVEAGKVKAMAVYSDYAMSSAGSYNTNAGYNTASKVFHNISVLSADSINRIKFSCSDSSQTFAIGSSFTIWGC